MLSTGTPSQNLSRTIFAGLVAIVIWHSLPVLSVQPVAGWDLLPHLALFERFLEVLRSGHLSEYSLQFDAGVPLFSLYPPLFYLVAALPHIASFTAISPILSFNLTLFLLPLAFLWAAARAGRSYLGASWVLAPMYAAIFLLLDARFFALGIGLGGVHIMGLSANFLGLIWILLLLAEFPLLSSGIRRSSICRIALLVGALILTSILMAVFAAWITALACLFSDSKGRTRLFAGSALGILIALVWWQPFLALLPFSSGQAEFSAGERGDFLSVFYPVIHSGLPFFVHSSQLLDRPPFHPFFKDPSFSFCGIVIAIASISGLAALFSRRQWLLPVAFIGSFALIEGGFLFELLHLPMHFYRFAAPLWLVHILICACGTHWIAERLHATRTPLLLPLLSLLVGYQAVRYTPEDVWGNVSPYMAAKPKVGRFAQSNFRAYPASQRIMRAIKKLPASKNSRFATESSSRAFFELGTPHFFMTSIARETGYEVLPGLLAESTLSSAYVIPTLGGGAVRTTASKNVSRRVSSQIQWGDKELVRQSFFRDRPPYQMVNRLRSFGVRYLVTTTRAFRIRLERCRRCRASRVVRAGSFALFDLNFSAPRCTVSDTPPLCFVDAGGIPFKQFSKWFYASDSYGRVPLIYSGQGLDALDKVPGPHPVSGVIVSLDPRKPVPDADLDRWSRYGKTLLLNPGRRSFPQSPQNLRTIRTLVTAADMYRVDAELLRLFPHSQRTQSCSIESSPGEFRIEARGPTTIRYNFNPGFRSRDPLFMTVPPFTFLYSDGESSISF